MSPAISSSLGIVAYLTLFALVGVVFLFVNLLIGRFVRPNNPEAEKSEIYECGEPAIGSSFVQFDLRFYVVALLFIIFDVEVAFFFPWAAVFGKATNLSDPNFAVVESGQLTDSAIHLYREIGVRNPQVDPRAPEQDVRAGASKLAWVSLADIGVFFAVLLVGFAYVWKRGDLDWVRAVADEKSARGDPTSRARHGSGKPGPTVSVLSA